SCFFFFFSSRRRHTRWPRDWSSDVCSSDLLVALLLPIEVLVVAAPPLAQLRVEIDVGEADGARQKSPVPARQEPFVVEADPVEVRVGVDVAGTEAVAVVGDRLVEARTPLEEVIKVCGSYCVPRGQAERKTRLNGLRHVHPEVLAKP